MSAPAQNALAPAPRRTTQRRSSSAESSRIRSPSSLHDARDNALSFAGWLSTTVAIAPSRSTRIRSDIGQSLVEQVHQAEVDHGAGANTEPIRATPDASSGQTSSTSASVVIVPTRPLDQNTRMSPPAPIIDRRNASSLRLPSTKASVNGARGMPIFLNT